MSEYEESLIEQRRQDLRLEKLDQEEELRRHRKRRVALYVLLLLLIPALIALEEIPKYAAIAPCPDCKPGGPSACPLGDLAGNGNNGDGNGIGDGKGNGKGKGPGTGTGTGTNKGPGAPQMIEANLPSDMSVQAGGGERAPASRPSIYGDTQRPSTPRQSQGREVALASTPRESQARDLANTSRAPQARDGVAEASRGSESRHVDERSSLYAPMPPVEPPPYSPPPQAMPPAQQAPPSTANLPPTAPPTTPEPSAPPAIPTVVPKADVTVGPQDPLLKQ